MREVRQRESWWVEGLYRDEDDYYRCDGEMDRETFRTACLNVGRNEGPALLHDLYHTGSLSVVDNPGIVADVWSMAEFPVNLLPDEMWVGLFEEAGYTHDGQPAPRPTDAVTVYRGALFERRRGMSWTTDMDRARWFAERDLGGGRGMIWAYLAPPEALLAFIHDSSRGEAEHVVNTAFMSGGDVAHVHAGSKPP